MITRLYYTRQYTLIGITNRDKKNIQQLETEVVRIQDNVNLGKNWNPDMEKSLRELAKVKAELEIAIEAEKAAAIAAGIKLNENENKT